VNAISGLVLFVTLILVLGYYFIINHQTRTGAHK